MKRVLLLFIIFLFPLFSNAQQLTLKNAIDTTLKNNFDIQIAKNKVEIARISNSYGVAGGLPSISFSAGDNQAWNTVDQDYSNGLQTRSQNIDENTFNAGVTAGMTLFNGFKVLATKERMKCLQQQSEILFNQQVQNSIAAVMVEYYDIIRQQSYLNIIKNSLDVSIKKLDIINEKDKVGMANAVDKLQAQMDVNSAEQNVKAQQLIIDAAKSDLLVLMGVKSPTTITVDDSITVDETIRLDSVINFLNRNPEYLSAEQQIRINEQIVKEMSAQRYPSVKISTAYDFYHADNSAGTLLMNQSYGPSAAVALQIPIFNGNAYKKEKQVAVLNVENSKLEKESLLNVLTSDAMKTYTSYTTTLEQLKVQQQNYELAKKLVSVVMQNFQLNQSTILDVKAAQTSFENAGYLLVNLQYAAKSAEIELKQLIYQLKY
jgi:outer membrane protein